MQEKTRVQAWAVSGLAMLIPLVILTSDTVTISGELGIFIWSTFIMGLVLFGMALVGFLMITQRKRAIILTIVLVFALAISFIAVGKGPRMSLGASIGEALCFFLFSYVLMASWQLLLNGQTRGFLTRSAYIDAAVVNLLLNIAITNVLRSVQGPYPNLMQSVWLVLALSMVSAVLSLSAIYAKPAGLKKGKAMVRPFAYAILLGFVLPILGIFAMMLTTGFSASM